MLSKRSILQKLEEQLSNGKTIKFTNTSRTNIKQAKLSDGSTLVIAAFDKDNGKTLAMIDHKNLPGDKDRNKIQLHLRQTIDRIFSPDGGL